MSPKRKMVAYYRVSTIRQGQSGLGLEAQERAVSAHVVSQDCVLLTSYTEIETGKKDTLDNRPELRKAIAHAKRSKAILVVAKMDRLSRSVAVTSALHNSGLEFIACDNPFANRMTIQILAAVAENEARAISTRTKDALASYKLRGGVLGSARPECRRNLTCDARAKGIALAATANRSNKLAAYEDIRPTMVDMRRDGRTLAGIAEKLNAEGHTTRNDKRWTATQVKRVLESSAFLS
jgi:DNA invertase Pin-like site-specific DNA recombinase